MGLGHLKDNPERIRAELIAIIELSIVHDFLLANIEEGNWREDISKNLAACETNDSLPSSYNITPAPGQQLDPLDQLVDAPKLLELLWAPDCPPCLRWLRNQQRQRAIPSVRRGRRVWFIPRDVMAALAGPARLRKGMALKV